MKKTPTQIAAKKELIRQLTQTYGFQTPKIYRDLYESSGNASFCLLVESDSHIAAEHLPVQRQLLSFELAKQLGCEVLVTTLENISRPANREKIRQQAVSLETTDEKIIACYPSVSYEFAAADIHKKRAEMLFNNEEEEQKRLLQFKETIAAAKKQQIPEREENKLVSSSSLPARSSEKAPTDFFKGKLGKEENPVELIIQQLRSNQKIFQMVAENPHLLSDVERRLLDQKRERMGQSGMAAQESVM